MFRFLHCSILHKSNPSVDRRSSQKSCLKSNQKVQNHDRVHFEWYENHCSAWNESSSNCFDGKNNQQQKKTNDPTIKNLAIHLHPHLQTNASMLVMFDLQTKHSH